MKRYGFTRFTHFTPGFTLVEVLVTIVLVVVAVVGVFGGIRALTAADIKARDADLLQRLALEKFREFSSVTDPQTAEDTGDFTEQGYPNVNWSVEIEPSGAENIDQLTVTTTRSDGTNSQSLSGLVYTPPPTTEATTGADAGATP
jgi:type II secretory pathway pseudopilin PulG